MLFLSAFLAGRMLSGLLRSNENAESADTEAPRSDRQSPPQDLVFRKPCLQDVPAIYGLVQGSGLDVNSPYMYMLCASHFSDTCVVTEVTGNGNHARLAGILMGYRHPREKSTLFVWQIAVSREFLRQAIAKRMVLHLIDRLRDVNYVEGTVNPGNSASENLFKSLGRSLSCPVEVTPALFRACASVEPPTKDENLFCVGPFHCAEAT